MINKKLRNSTTTSPNEGFYDPDQPKNHREEREEGKGARARARDKEQQQYLVYISWGLEQQKKPGQAQSQTLTQGDMIKIKTLHFREAFDLS